MNRKSALGFTLVELLVVIAIIGVMVAMSIPAIQASRETGRRAMCQMHLAQIMLALQNYESAFEAFPAGVINADEPIRNEPVGLHQSWMIQLLPYLDDSTAYRLVDFSKSVYDPANAQVRELSLPGFICPSEPLSSRGQSNYAGCHHDVEAPIAADNHGALVLNHHFRRVDIADGLAYTLFVAEKPFDVNDLGWMSGTRATLRNTGLPPNDSAVSSAVGPQEAGDDEDSGDAAPPSLLYVGGFASAHPNGVFVGYGDGSVRFTAATIDLDLWQHLANRADGKALDVTFGAE